MAFVNWRKLAIPSANPDSDHLFVGVDETGKVYLKNDAGLVLRLAYVGDPQKINSYATSAVIVDDDYSISTASTSSTFTLPNASVYARTITVKNGGTGVLTVQGVSSQTIDGHPDIQLDPTNAVTLIPKSGAWFIC